ncbi:LAETG motif-containing sortase-dependent surface protein [Allostreptomyces psammosilenae]|uniref:Uncharacterized protein n=1 Tax=Allostreptomyces psammosilenae TaxID=1892865 RepID=A0A853A626_9ACTN|nr:LAETG motif-containing sortase-dependent surface protein [Allostreptomyces psammosilenae]NYI05988.1 hypothetical protein [Allostreptomyces psammosilenae]
MSLRTFVRAAVAAPVVAGVMLAPTTALAQNGGNPPGSNGTVKVHDAVTDEEVRANQPKVCEFYLAGFQFDDLEKVDWRITPDWQGGEGEAVASGSIVLADGTGRTEDMTLPSGHYKVFWEIEGNQNPTEKHKVFKVECPDGGTSGGDGGSESAGGSEGAAAAGGAGETTAGGGEAGTGGEQATGGESTAGGQETTGGQETSGGEASTGGQETTGGEEAAAAGADASSPSPSAVPGNVVNPDGELAQTGGSITPMFAGFAALLVVVGVAARIGLRRTVAGS